MAYLINCFECGTQISSEAKECPKCNAPNGGHKCGICRRAEKRSNLVSGFHQDCLLKVREEFESIQFYYTCPICGLALDVKNINKEHIPVSCQKCGHPAKEQLLQLYSEIEKCDICRLPLIITAAEKVFDKVELYERNLRRPRWIHKLCSKHMDNKEYKLANSCFIATALYGEDSSKVRMLCFFRDEYLSISSLGRAFIALYVRFSPPLARAIAKESLLRTLVRYCIVAPALLFTEKFLAYAGRKEKLKQ